LKALAYLREFRGSNLLIESVNVIKDKNELKYVQNQLKTHRIQTPEILSGYVPA